MQQEWKNLLRKMSVEKEKQKLILGRCDRDRAWDRKKKRRSLKGALWKRPEKNGGSGV